MALYKFLCASMVMVTLSSRGCHSQLLTCGQAPNNNKIVGGQNASPGSWPWQVVLTDGDMPFCAGSLIHHQWVVTAAHCLTGANPKTTKVVLGRHSHSGSAANEQQRNIDRITCHPSYNFLSNDNDICLLKLSDLVTFTEYIQPVCLASSESTFHSGLISWVTGFGYTEPNTKSPSDILQEVDVPIVGNNECTCTHSSLTTRMICAGRREGGKDACLGDSGGPLVIKKGSIWIMIGVVSFGKGCGQPLSPGGYTRVSSFQGWISKNIGNNKPGFVTYLSSGEDSDKDFTCSSLTSPPPTTITQTPTTTTTTTQTPKITTTTTTQTPKTTTTTTQTPTTTTTTTAKKEECNGSVDEKESRKREIPARNVFDSGENLIQFSHFTSLCLLAASLYVLFGET